MKELMVMTVVLSLFSCKDKDDDTVSKNEMVDLPQVVHPLNTAGDLDTLINAIGNSQFILLGEASHGTSEYYKWRAEITKRLIVEKGISLIGVEGDWVNIYQINQYIKGRSNASNATDALRTFNRWPTWMWANEEIAALAEWLKEHNKNLSEENKVGFYGLDVYGLGEALKSALNYLEIQHPDKAQIARNAYDCFVKFEEDEAEYGYEAARGSSNCSKELAELLSLATSLRQSALNDEEVFALEQSALVAVNAEKYYKTSVMDYEESWNVRDKHMVQTLNRLLDFHGKEKKAVVWEHNTHVGDARFTDMKGSGMVNVGQLVREQHSEAGVFVVGFGSYQGTVIAASSWEAPMQVMTVPPSPSSTWESILHEIAPEDKIVFVNKLKHLKEFKKQIGHRAIGVVYNPNYERGNYVPSIIGDRYDAFIFIDKTTALHPIKPLGNEVGMLKNKTGFKLDNFFMGE